MPAFFLAFLVAFLSPSLAGARERDWFDSLTDALRPPMDSLVGIAQDRATRDLKFLNPGQPGQAGKPLEFKKGLRDCTKTPNVINDEVLKCMQGK